MKKQPDEIVLPESPLEAELDAYVDAELEARLMARCREFPDLMVKLSALAEHVDSQTS